MTKEQKDMLDKEITDAMASNDEARLRRVTARYIQAIGDCQYKTSERVKKLVIEDDREKERRNGFRAAIEIGKIIVSAGGGMALLKALGG